MFSIHCWLERGSLVSNEEFGGPEKGYVSGDHRIEDQQRRLSIAGLGVRTHCKIKAFPD